MLGRLTGKMQKDREGALVTVLIATTKFLTTFKVSKFLKLEEYIYSGSQFNLQSDLWAKSWRWELDAAGYTESERGEY